MRRLLVALALALAAAGSPVTLAAHATPAAPHQASAGGLRADFNADGFADLAVGVPGEDVGSVVDAGAVNVQYGSAGGLTATPGQLFTQTAGSAPETGDFFGEAVAAGDFNDDGFPDLAVGASGEDVGAVADAGAVTVLYGSASGLSHTGEQLFTQVGSAPETNDEFGFTVATGDFNNDGFADLAVGAPFETGVGPSGASTPFSGAVSILYGSAGGLTRVGGQLFTEVGSPVETDDTYGFVLTSGDFDNDGFADLAVGAPFEDVGAVVDGGAINVLYGASPRLTTARGRLFTQVGDPPDPSDLFGFSLAAGDFSGDGFSDLAVSAPNQNVGAAVGAGAVSILPGSPGGTTDSGGQLFTQVGSAPETGDAFGFALATGDVNGNGTDDLLAGAAFEDGVRVIDSGAVSVLYGTAGTGLSRTGGRLFTQIGSAAENDDVFGYSLAVGDFDGSGIADLAAAAPNEDVGTIDGAGAVSVYDGATGGLTTTGGYLFDQDTPGVGSLAEAGDFFGGSLAAAAIPAPATAVAGASRLARRMLQRGGFAVL